MRPAELLSNAVRTPVWFAELFTTTKSFTANPLLGSPTLNRLGLHVARVRAAHAMSHWRSLFLGHLISDADQRQFREQGYLTIHNVLAPDAFARMREEILAFSGDLRRMVQADTFTYQGLLDDAALAHMPTSRALLTERGFLGRLMAGGYVLKHPMFFAHLVVNGAASSASRDPQKDLHADTFHPTMKAWLFLDDVTADNGPFHYVPGSHRLTPERLAWEHDNAVAGRDLANTYARRGSLRIAPQDLAARGFAEPVALEVPANTLVMADTFGFHRRGDAQPGASRLAVYAYSRANPFNPFPGALPGLRARLEQAMTRASLAAADRAAAREDRQPTWQRVSPQDLRANALTAPAAASAPPSTAA